MTQRWFGNLGTDPDGEARTRSHTRAGDHAEPEGTVEPAERDPASDLSAPVVGKPIAHDIGSTAPALRPVAADPFLLHLLRHLGVWLAFQVLVLGGWMLGQPAVVIAGIVAAGIAASGVLTATGYRRRDLVLLVVPVVSLVVGHRCVWRYTSRYVYWEHSPQSRSGRRSWRPAAIALGWIGFPVLLAVTASASARPVPTAGSERSAPASGRVATAQAVAERIALQADDFPAGWRTGALEDVLDAQTMQNLDELRTLSEASNWVWADSQVYFRLTATASSTVRLAPTAALAENEFDILEDPEAGGTWDEAAAELASDMPGDVSVAETSTFEVPGIGDDALGVRFVFTSVVGDDKVRMYADTFHIRHGRVLAMVEFFESGEPFPSPLAHELVAKVAARMAEAQ